MIRLPPKRGPSPNIPVGERYPTPWTSGCLDMAALSDIGTRTENQDAFYLDPAWGVIAVADGMGGEGNHGGYAANAAVGQVRTVLSTGRHRPGNPTDLYQSAASHVQSSLNRARKHGGTCLTVLELTPDRVSAAWGGDVTLIRVPLCGLAIRLTQPHNVPGGDLRKGKITEEAYRNRDDGNILTHGILPTSAPPPEVISRLQAPGVGDVYVLCTDGLFDLLGTVRIGEIVSRRPGSTTAQGHAENLLEAGRWVGFQDNATVATVVVRAKSGQGQLERKAR